MKKSVLCVLLSLCVCGGASPIKEPSVFMGGEFTKANPSSLTPLEKEVVSQKSTIEKLQRDLQDLSLMNSELRQSLEGLRSLYESTASKNSELLKRLDEVEKRPFGVSDNNDSKETLEKLSSKVDENSRLQNENFDKIGKTINEMVGVVETMKQTYVSKDELNATLQTLQQKAQEKGTIAEKVEPKAEQKGEKTPQEIRFSQGVALFEKGQWIKAQKIFEALKAENVNLEGTYFYLGEIAFVSNDYRNANVMYQKSLDTNANSQYVPKILLHAGQVSQRTGDHAGAKKVFETLLEVYPTSQEAKEATKLLKK